MNIRGKLKLQATLEKREFHLYIFEIKNLFIVLKRNIISLKFMLVDMLSLFSKKKLFLYIYNIIINSLDQHLLQERKESLHMNTNNVYYMIKIYLILIVFNIVCFL